MTRLAAIILSAALSSTALAADWPVMLADKLSDPDFRRLSAGQLEGYFGRLLEVSQLYADTCHPVLVVKSGEAPISGAIGAVGQTEDCSAPKPVLFLRLQIAAPEFAAVRTELERRLGRPCFDGPGPYGSAAMTAWSEPSRIVGVVAGVRPEHGFTLFAENRGTGKGADPDAEAALRRDVEADLPSVCR